MAYRSDDEALRARIKDLEAELFSAQSTIERLRGTAPKDVEPAGRDRITGLIPYLERRIELPFAIPEPAFVAIADHLNERIPGGSIAQIANTLTHRKGSYQMRIEREVDRTVIHLTGDYRPARTQLLMGSPGLALLGALFCAFPAAALELGAAGIALAVVFGMFSGFYLLRHLIKKGMEQDQQKLNGAFEAVRAIAEEHRERARIEEARAEIQPAAEAEAQAEALQAEQARAAMRR